MTIKRRQYLAFAACVTSLLFCSESGAQTRVDEWLSVKTGPVAVLLDPSSSSVVVATAAAGTRVRAHKFQDGWYLVSLAKAADERAPVSGWVPAAMLTRVMVEVPVATSGRIEPQAEVVTAEPPIPLLEEVADPSALQIKRDELDRAIQATETLARSELAAVNDTPVLPAKPPVIEYRVLATSKTSTMQKEMQEAAEAGFRFGDVMGGDTTFGGSEVVVIMHRGGSPERFAYRLLATSKTSTMQKEMQEAGDAGFEYRGQTVFKSKFGGKEVVAILESPAVATNIVKYEYRLLASKKTSTLEKELLEAGDQAFEFVGMTVAKTLVGGEEVVAILRRKL